MRVSLSWAELCTGAPSWAVELYTYIFLVVFHGQQLASIYIKSCARWVREVFIDITGRYQPPITPAIICCGRINAYRIRHNASQVTTPERPSAQSKYHRGVSHAHKNILCLLQRTLCTKLIDDGIARKNNTHPCAYEWKMEHATYHTHLGRAATPAVSRLHSGALSVK